MNLPKNNVNLKVDFCSYEAAKYACEHWHYSKCVPVGKLITVGVWENNQFIGSVLFGRGANNSIGKPYGLKQTEVCELVRVSLKHHSSPVSQIVSVAIKLIKKNNEGLKLIISYADPEQGHIGGIYQAMNWLYHGKTSSDFAVIIDGKKYHSRVVSSSGYKKQFGKYKKVPKPADGEKIIIQGKHKYLYPLDRKLARQIKQIALPYPKNQNADSLR